MIVITHRDLKVILMSATVDANLFSNYFDRAPVEFVCLEFFFCYFMIMLWFGFLSFFFEEDETVFPVFMRRCLY
jgi:hypothetical protein